MSWLARSIANSLRIDDDADANNLHSLSSPHRRRLNPTAPENDVMEERESDGFERDLRGVKDDLGEFKETLTRQFWGVANFLAPPPTTTTTSSSSQSHDQRVISESNRSESTDPSISGDEDGDSSVNSRNSTTNRNYSEIRVLENCKSSLNSHRLGLQKVEEEEYGDDDGDGDDGDDGDGDGVGDGDGDDDDGINQAVGLTDEVLTFAGDIGHHPETWLDFPVDDEEQFEDFPMSVSQKRHAQAVERLARRLAALRIELCPAHMSVGFFWKVYFVLLHSRLNKQDAELLSTPEVVEARAKWMQEQQKGAKKDSEWFYGGLYSRESADLDDDCTPRSLQNEHSETSSWTFFSEPATSSTTAESEVEKHAVSTELQLMDKSIIDEKPLANAENKNILTASTFKRPVLSIVDDENDSDDWPEDDCLGQSGRFIPVGIADEISFSDLEDDDCCIPVISKPYK